MHDLRPKVSVCKKTGRHGRRRELEHEEVGDRLACFSGGRDIAIEIVCPDRAIRHQERRCIPDLGQSSFVIVPVALPSAIVAPTGAERTTWKVSFCSTTVSPTTDTLIVCAVVAPLNVRVPLVAV